MKTIIRVIFSIILVTILASCNTFVPTVSPTITKTNYFTPSPYPIASATITPTEKPEPVFPGSGVMKSEHLTVSLSQRWMNAAGISDVTLEPELLEQVYQAMLVHWAASLGVFGQDESLLSFTDNYSCPDRSSILNVQKAFQSNSEKPDKFNYSFDFGQGVSGKIESIEIKAMANEQEYKLIAKELEKENVIAHLNTPFGTDDKSIFYIDNNNILHIYTWDGAYYGMKYLDSPDRSMALSFDLFINPLLNGEYAIGNTQKKYGGQTCNGGSIFEVVGCNDEMCNGLNFPQSKFVVTLKDGTIAPIVVLPTKIMESPTPIIIKTLNEPIKIGDYLIVIRNAQVSDVGSNLFGLNSNMALHFVMTEETGKIKEISGLAIIITDNEGNVLKNTIVQSIVGSSATSEAYQWISYIPEPAKSYYLHFPTGEVIDLTPLLNN